MTKNELAMRLARLLLLKEGGGTLESFESLLCLRSYFSELTLDELHQIAPKCWQVLQDRGNYFMHCKEHRRAESDFSCALELQPKRPELYNDRGVCRFAQKQYEGALTDLDAALRLRPGFAQAHSNIGNVQRELGDLSKAKAAYNAALLLDANDSRTWNNRGALQEQLNNLVAAELDVRRALELGGCEKAKENLERIAAALRGIELELSPLKTSWCEEEEQAAPLAPGGLHAFGEADDT